MIIKLLTEHHLEFLSLKGGCTGSSESIHVKTHIVENHMSRPKCHLPNLFFFITISSSGSFLISISHSSPSSSSSSSGSNDSAAIYKQNGERSDSVVECMTRDRGAAGSSLTCITALCP